MEPIDALTATDAVLQPGPQSRSAIPDDSGGFLLADVSPEPITIIATPFSRQSNETAERCLDLVIGFLLLVLTLPLMAACALAVILSSRGPVLFRQTRIGRDGREFKCLKFRTMVPNADAVFLQFLQNNDKAKDEWLSVQKLHDDPRVTPAGRFLRRYCLDELPQLFNVLGGDMSIVGPRPIVAAEIVRYGPYFYDYCTVKPGLTGLWQVSGRHRLSYDERVQLDSKYARTKSLSADLMILWRTVPIVLFGTNE